MIYLKTFKLSDRRSKNYNIYPYNVLKGKEPDIFIFDNITVLYGNNGSGKSTILNIIANKLNLDGREMISSQRFFYEYTSLCEYSLGNDEYGKMIKIIPNGSRYIKSEELLYEVSKIQNDSILEESYILGKVKEGMDKKQAKELIDTKQGLKELENIRFGQEKYSNGETAMQYFVDRLEPDKLYLLDEPEVSLSIQSQIELANIINHMSRYLNCQFIISTHSPFILGTLNAKIYNLDTKNYDVQNWNELENVKLFYKFFKEKENELKN